MSSFLLIITIVLMWSLVMSVALGAVLDLLSMLMGGSERLDRAGTWLKSFSTVILIPTIVFVGLSVTMGFFSLIAFIIAI